MMTSQKRYSSTAVLNLGYVEHPKEVPEKRIYSRIRLSIVSSQFNSFPSCYALYIRILSTKNHSELIKLSRHVYKMYYGVYLERGTYTSDSGQRVRRPKRLRTTALVRSCMYKRLSGICKYNTT